MANGPKIGPGSADAQAAAILVLIVIVVVYLLMTFVVVPLTVALIVWIVATPWATAVCGVAFVWWVGRYAYRRWRDG